jgi:hypothetical protein
MWSSTVANRPSSCKAGMQSQPNAPHRRELCFLPFRPHCNPFVLVNLSINTDRKEIALPLNFDVPLSSTLLTIIHNSTTK